MPNNFANQPRITIDGKFFRLGAEKFFVKGVSYGPFAPNGEMEMFPSREQAGRDFRQLQQLGVNLLRVYYVPPKWFLELAADFSIKLLIDIPWPSHLCFLESEEPQEQAREAVRSAALHCKDHSAVFALSVANEIPAEIVRWTGVKRVGAFIEELIGIVKSIDSNLLCTFASFPPTEFLTASNSDFISFNVYLHQAAAFQKYVARLQMLANAKPLVLAEVGLDSIREGEQRQADVLKEQLEIAARSGLAGTIVYSFTDDWFKGGSQVRDWGFGLTNVAREAKRSFAAVKQFYEQAPYVPLSRQPKVSVVIASYNGARTLDACLASVTRLNYPYYEVILVDDGSTDETQNIVEGYPRIQTLRQTNQGLSAARNAGITAASGEIVAFTDADCRVDEDWLYYLVQLLVQNNYMGVGGHNFLPPEDSPMAAVVLVSPGGPAHVMLTDEEAEHIPGCNMAFYKWALKEINGFDPVFRNAGDDVDVCWRLQERGYRLGFTPGGFVWHYRRATVRAYLRQQAGYGEAEALLIQKHPEHYNALGGNMWRGRIYGVARVRFDSQSTGNLSRHIWKRLFPKALQYAADQRDNALHDIRVPSDGKFAHFSVGYRFPLSLASCPRRIWCKRGCVHHCRLSSGFTTRKNADLDSTSGCFAFFSPADCSWLGEIFYSLERAFGCAGNLNRVFKSSDTG